MTANHREISAAISASAHAASGGSGGIEMASNGISGRNENGNQ